MTPDFADQEAERLIHVFYNTISNGYTNDKVSKEIAEALRKAYQKGIQEASSQTYWEDRVKEAHEESRHEALEQAAKVVSETPGNTYSTDCDHDELAEQIRALKPEATNGESQSEGE